MGKENKHINGITWKEIKSLGEIENDLHFEFEDGRLQKILASTVVYPIALDPTYIDQGGCSESLLVKSPEGELLFAKTLNGERISAQPLIEATILSQFRHRNIAQYKGLAIDPKANKLFLLTEHLSGGSLLARVSDYNDISFLRDTFWGIGSALQYIHKKGYVHGDPKTEDILFNDKGIPKLVDFGMAGKIGKGLAAGTPAYVPAERCAGEFYTSGDMYSFAIVVFQMLNQNQIDTVQKLQSRNLSFYGGDKIKANEISGFYARQLGPENLRGLVNILNKTIINKPENRPGDEEFMAELYTSLQPAYSSQRGGRRRAFSIQSRV